MRSRSSIHSRSMWWSRTIFPEKARTGECVAHTHLRILLAADAEPNLCRLLAGPRRRSDIRLQGSQGRIEAGRSREVDGCLSAAEAVARLGRGAPIDAESWHSARLRVQSDAENAQHGQPERRLRRVLRACVEHRPRKGL